MGLIWEASEVDVASELGISPALASHHLTALRDLGPIDGTRFGRYVYYRTTPAVASSGTRSSPDGMSAVEDRCG